jgi:TetR/AcrR family transcriptional repressor of nem operon
MLTDAMSIGRQSLYDTFGDKWQLYCASLQRYADAETQAHITALRSGPHAIDGIRAMLERVIADVRLMCLGVNSICEFGRSWPELAKIHNVAKRALRTVIVRRVREAQAEGDAAPDLDPSRLPRSCPQTLPASASPPVLARATSSCRLSVN